MEGGRDSEALATATRAAVRMFDLAGVADDFVHMWPFAANLALQLGDSSTLNQLLDLVDDAAGRMRLPLGVQAHRTRIAGLLEAERDPQNAERLLVAAIEGFTGWGSPHHRARTEGELAALLQAQGRAEEAAALLERAVATLTEVGAHAWLADVGAVVGSS